MKEKNYIKKVAFGAVRNHIRSLTVAVNNYNILWNAFYCLILGKENNFFF